MPVDGATFAAELVAIDGDGRLTFQPVAEATSPGESVPRTLAADQLVRWSHPAPPRPQTFVLLADGSRLVTAADWSGGAAVKLDGDAFVVTSDVWDDVRLARAAVRGLVFAVGRSRHDRRQLELQVRAAEADQDAVQLTNGDRLTGRVAGLSGGSLTLSTAAGDVQLPLSRVEAVEFANSGGWGRARPPLRGGAREPPVGAHAGGSADRASGTIDARPQPPAACWIVGLRDGSLLYATTVRGSDEALSIDLAGGTTLSGGAIDDVAALQSLGGRFEYLSDLQPADYRHVPYLDVPWPYQRDRTVTGGPLEVDGREYLKGIGMHSAGRLTYTWPGLYQRFNAEVAIDDSAGGRGFGASAQPSGSVAVAVYVLRHGQWQRAYQSETLRGGQPPVPVAVDLTGAAGLTLTVDFADRGDELDRADWLDARLVK